MILHRREFLSQLHCIHTFLGLAFHFFVSALDNLMELGHPFSVFVQFISMLRLSERSNELTAGFAVHWNGIGAKLPKSQGTFFLKKVGIITLTRELS